MPQRYADALSESFISKALLMKSIWVGELSNGAGFLSNIRKLLLDWSNRGSTVSCVEQSQALEGGSLNIRLLKKHVVLISVAGASGGKIGSQLCERAPAIIACAVIPRSRQMCSIPYGVVNRAFVITFHDCQDLPPCMYL